MWEFQENVAFLFIPRSDKYHKGDPAMGSLDRFVRTNEFSEVLILESSLRASWSLKGPAPVTT